MRRLLIVASLVLLTEAGMAQNKARISAKPLSDAVMDKVTAGGVTAGGGSAGISNVIGNSSAGTPKGIGSSSAGSGSAGSFAAGMSNGVVNFQGSVPTKMVW